MDPITILLVFFLFISIILSITALIRTTSSNGLTGLVLTANTPITTVDGSTLSVTDFIQQQIPPSSTPSSSAMTLTGNTPIANADGSFISISDFIKQQIPPSSTSAPTVTSLTANTSITDVDGKTLTVTDFIKQKIPPGSTYWKQGNNGTQPCSSFCNGYANFGPVGFCVGGGYETNTKEHQQYSCSDIVSQITTNYKPEEHNIACLCSNPTLDYSPKT